MLNFYILIILFFSRIFCHSYDKLPLNITIAKMTIGLKIYRVYTAISDVANIISTWKISRMNARNYSIWRSSILLNAYQWPESHSSPWSIHRNSMWLISDPKTRIALYHLGMCKKRSLAIAIAHAGMHRKGRMIIICIRNRPASRQQKF